MMKKFFVIAAIFLLGFSSPFTKVSNGESLPKVACFHYTDDPYDVTWNDCWIFTRILFKAGLKHYFRDFKYKDYFIDENMGFFIGGYDIVYYAGFNEPTGFWIRKDGSKKINICSLLNTGAKIIIVDACYSGMIFDCPNYDPEKQIVITSTNRESVSTNVDYYSTFILALMCAVAPDMNPRCREIIGCRKDQFDFQVCQIGIWWWKMVREGDSMKNRLLRTLIYYPEIHPNVSIGTAMFNGKPWR